MKRFITYILLFAIVGCSGMLSACNKNGENTDYGFYDPNTDTEYTYCTPSKLYPVTADEEEEYLTIQQKDGSSRVFYKVYFEDPLEFLCYKDAGYFFLAMNRDMDEPTVTEFNPIAASIYSETNLTKIGDFYADNEYLPDEKKEHSPTEDSWLCQMIAQHIDERENVNVMATAEEITNIYRIRLLSQDYPGLYYLITFFEYNGRYYLEDKSINKTVVCPNDVVARMVGQ